ncbi:WG repeat-containing protein [Cohnella faecalis]|uniref:WG repeat-containing protein n=1 Tax=Cohnella faecalis TaxID=2315694 RepID=UPI0011C22975
MKGKVGFIDKKGKLVIQAKNYGVDSFYEGMAAFVATEDSKLGYMDKTGLRRDVRLFGGHVRGV